MAAASGSTASTFVRKEVSCSYKYDRALSALSVSTSAAGETGSEGRFGWVARCEMSQVVLRNKNRLIYRNYTQS